MTKLRVPIAVSVIATLAAVAQLGSDPSNLDLRTPLAAGGNSLFADADRDMVPDCIEMLGLTDPGNPDTDGDGVDDFEEILTFTSQDVTIRPQPVDYGMRVLVTSTTHANGNTDVFLHLMMRFVNLGLEEISFESLFAYVEGAEISLLELLGYGEMHIAHRERQRDGVSYVFSFRVSSEEDLRRILPCTICARAVLGGRRITTGSLLLSTGTDMAAVMPFTGSSLMLQPVSTAAYLQDESPYYRGGGRVCEMQLSSIGTSNGGTLCEVDSAECKLAAGLRCSSSCSQKTGTTVVVPDGLGTITGGR